VTSGSKPIEKASVNIEITTSSGNILISDGATDDEGVAELKLRIKSERDSCGPYVVDTTATKIDFNQGSGSAMFDVVC